MHFYYLIDYLTTNLHIVQFSICGDEVTESKPSAYPLLTLCKQANISPEECIIVGDTSADTGMGRNANAALIVGVLTGSGTTEQLLKTGAHIVLPDISYLKQYLIPQKSLENDFGESFETIVVSKIQA